MGTKYIILYIIFWNGYVNYISSEEWHGLHINSVVYALPLTKIKYCTFDYGLTIPVYVIMKLISLLVRFIKEKYRDVLNDDAIFFKYP